MHARTSNIAHTPVVVVVVTGGRPAAMRAYIEQTRTPQERGLYSRPNRINILHIYTHISHTQSEWASVWCVCVCGGVRPVLYTLAQHSCTHTHTPLRDNIRALAEGKLRDRRSRASAQLQSALGSRFFFWIAVAVVVVVANEYYCLCRRFAFIFWLGLVFSCF